MIQATTRRRLLATTVGAAALGRVGAARAAGPIKIGYISPQTGPLAAFSAADDFTLAAARAAYAKAGLNTEILVRDSQSNVNRAAAVAGELINAGISLMLVGATPDTINPVSDQCEVGEVPCLSTTAPWQSWFFSRGGKPGEGFEWTYHYFWGLDEITAVYMAMWNQLDTNKVVGGLFPNDTDGNAWGDAKLGVPPILARNGFKLLETGRFQEGNDDFGAQIQAFKAVQSDIVLGVIIPPDLTTFWTQAKQQGLKPKIVTIAKALLFPSSVEALGAAGQNMSTEVWWSPSFPFRSSLTGQSCEALAADFTKQTGKPWTQPIGYTHSLFEIAADILKRARDPSDRPAVLAALTQTKLATIVGPIAWGKGPVKNVSVTPLAGGQWRMTGNSRTFDLVVTSNATAPMVPTADRMQPIG